jgi:hypothetical protein
VHGLGSCPCAFLGRWSVIACSITLALESQELQQCSPSSFSHDHSPHCYMSSCLLLPPSSLEHCALTSQLDTTLGFNTSLSLFTSKAQMNAAMPHRERDAAPIPPDIAEKMIAPKHKQARYVLHQACFPPMAFLTHHTTSQQYQTKGPSSCAHSPPISIALQATPSQADASSALI